MWVKVDYSIKAKRNPRPNMAGMWAIYTKRHWWNKWIERQTYADAFGFRLADSGAKCMSQVVAAKVRQYNRLSALLLRLNFLNAVVVICDALDCPVQR